MELINDFNKINPKSFNFVKCRRIGIDIDFFSSIYGRIVFAGKTNYISKKNYRSNQEFEEFKDKNIINKKILVIAVNEPIEKCSEMFNNDPKLFLSETFNYEPDIVIFAMNHNNPKIKKSKTFYLKSKNVLFKDKNDENLLIYNFTLECFCNFQN